VTPRLTRITVYPIKSARGIPVEQWELDEFGLTLDRRWMVVDAGGQFISQRDYPRLALVIPSVADGRLRVDAPGRPTLEIPVHPSSTVFTRVTIWNDTCEAAWAGEAAARWFSELLGCAASLVHMPAQTMREANLVYAPSGTRVSFADAYPILLISEESLADLNARLPEPLPMNRFRPNLVVSGWGAPYGEDSWAELRVGEVAFGVVKACARCVTTTTDQATAERGVEPLATLARYRRVPRGVLFGQNLIQRGHGAVAVGDSVRILSRR
jgi:uncharacterized protein